MNCQGCKYWSEMIAKCEGGGPVEAYCFNKKSIKYQSYTHAGYSEHVEGEPIDAPN